MKVHCLNTVAKDMVNFGRRQPNFSHNLNTVFRQATSFISCRFSDLKMTDRSVINLDSIAGTDRATT